MPTTRFQSLTQARFLDQGTGPASGCFPPGASSARSTQGQTCGPKAGSSICKGGYILPRAHGLILIVDVGHASIHFPRFFSKPLRVRTRGPGIPVSSQLLPHPSFGPLLNSNLELDDFLTFSRHSLPNRGPSELTCLISVPANRPHHVLASDPSPTRSAHGLRGLAVHSAKVAIPNLSAPVFESDGSRGSRGPARYAPTRITTQR